MVKYIIRATDERDDETDEPLYWCNEWGWVGRESADTFDDQEGTLPMGGVWEKLSNPLAEPSRVEVYKQGRWIGAQLIEFATTESGFTFAVVYPDDDICRDVFYFWRLAYADRR
jgi:hypothetical protein